MFDRPFRVARLALDAAERRLDATAIEIVEDHRGRVESPKSVGEQLPSAVDVSIAVTCGQHSRDRGQDLGQESRCALPAGVEGAFGECHRFVVFTPFGSQRGHVGDDQSVDVATLVRLVGGQCRLVVDDGPIGIARLVMNRRDGVQDVALVDAMIGRSIETEGAQTLSEGFAVVAGVGVDQPDEVQGPRPHERESVGVGEFVGFHGEGEGVPGLTVVMRQGRQSVEALPFGGQVAVTTGEPTGLLHEAAGSTRIGHLERSGVVESIARVGRLSLLELLPGHGMRIDPTGRELEKSGGRSDEKYWPTAASRATMREVGSRRQRRIDRAAVAGLVPLVAVVPIFLLAMVPFWWIVSRFLTIGYLPTVGLYALVGGLLFVPVVQRRILTRLIGARRPTRDEAPRLQRAFDEVTQALHIRDHRFAVGVIDSDELNAFACGGHLVVVTSFAARELDHDALCGVLAHEFCHHLGSHTVTLTVQQWLLVPVDALARVGGFLDNVAVAAASTFGAKSRPVAVAGRLAAPVFRALAWFFALGRTVSSALSNLVGRAAEFRADQRVVTMGYGRQLASALRRTVATSSRVTSRVTARGHTTFWTRIQESHPPARTRIARLEATLRRRDLR